MKTAVSRPPSTVGRRALRFPCGHTAAERRVAAGVRERPDAVWVRCPRCNLIAIVVARGRRR